MRMMMVMMMGYPDDDSDRAVKVRIDVVDLGKEVAKGPSSSDHQSHSYSSLQNGSECILSIKYACKVTRVYAQTLPLPEYPPLDCGPKMPRSWHFLFEATLAGPRPSWIH